MNNATITGTITDATRAILPGADLLLRDVNGSVQRRTLSEGDGGFIFSNLPPATYVLRVSLTGFTTTELRNLALNVDDRIAMTIELTPGSRGESVTVIGQASRVNTSPAVSTVIDRQFIENLPLNGRSLQSLLGLTPGVIQVPAAGATGAASGNGGQFSVNGQRANANSFTVDGVSANTAIVSGSVIGASPGQSGSGQLPALTAFGTTSSLVSVDAMEEFRLQTSTYAPEFGRTPGGQVSLITRSGTNTFRGSVSEYFRHDRLNATDWFTNNHGLEKPRMRQNNFAGVLGGPLMRSRSFFFVSYEGHRVEQPRSIVNTVPTLELRQRAPAEIQPYLNVFPLPNSTDLGNGFALLGMSYSDQLRSDATSLRLDHRMGNTLLFGRVNHAPSWSSTRALSSVSSRHSNSMNVTLGWTWAPSARVVHDLRAGYAATSAPALQQPDEFAGAVPLPASIFAPGRNPQNTLFQLGVIGGGSWLWGSGPAYEQRSINVVDSLTWTVAGHEFKFGIDFRRLNPLFGGGAATAEEILTFTLASLSTGRASRYDYTVADPVRRSGVFKDLSVFVQDHWRVHPRLTLTYGIRWELVPPPRSLDVDNPLTLKGLDDPYSGQVQLAESNTPLWRTRYGNVAARIGASYLLSQRQDGQLTIRTGVGKFYDLGLGHVANAFVGYPYMARRSVASVPLPLALDAREPPPLGVGPPTEFWAMDRNIELPYTWQWNVSAEQNLGPQQTLTVSYVGAEGRKLLKLDRYTIALVEWPASRIPVNVNRNRGYSDYRALQLQFQRRLHKGLQSIVSYSFGRSRDTASSDIAINVPAERLPPHVDYGYSDFDVRHTLAAAVTWSLSSVSRQPILEAVSRGWSVDMLLHARSGLPISITTNVPFPPDTQAVRPDVVEGQPFWIDDVSVPGGRRVNRQAFTEPPAQTQGGLSRGQVRGFAARQLDLAVRRAFALPRRTQLQVRVEVFNLFNTPMFANPTTSASLSASNFGQATRTLADGLGGLSSVYQLGGPRTMQIATKFLF